MRWVAVDRGLALSQPDTVRATIRMWLTEKQVETAAISPFQLCLTESYPLFSAHLLQDDCQAHEKGWISQLVPNAASFLASKTSHFWDGADWLHVGFQVHG